MSQVEMSQILTKLSLLHKALELKRPDLCVPSVDLCMYDLMDVDSLEKIMKNSSNSLLEKTKEMRSGP
jgi:hypothetical protein